MKVNVAGAGAGKTTMLANMIAECNIPSGKIVFCIAFTNAAAENIKKRLYSKIGEIPNNIRISTIHSFLYHELIMPYYFILYGKHYKSLSVIDLPSNHVHKQIKLSELESNNILHLTKIPEKAKWIAYGKSGDKKKIKDIRRTILHRFLIYCSKIFVDEAQDINDDVKHVLEALDRSGVEIILYGDPKQDIKGLGCFKSIIGVARDVKYISICHRCPQKHLNLSNTLASELERQTADDKNNEGSIDVVFESDITDIKRFFSDENYGLQYISMKRRRFATHKKDEKKRIFDTLRYEVYKLLAKKWAGSYSEIEINRMTFYVSEQMLQNYNNGDDTRKIISYWVDNGTFCRLTNKQFAQITSVFHSRDDDITEIPVVQSIDIVKGLEAMKCLFILTTDLAPYLFGEKTEDNKMSHLLYVALTRSLDQLVILVTKEVEDVYTRGKIEKFFGI